MKTLKQKIAYEIWGTNPDDFNAEAKAGTPYQNDTSTLNDIEDLITNLTDKFKNNIIEELEFMAKHFKQYDDFTELRTVNECISKIKSL